MKIIGIDISAKGATFSGPVAPLHARMIEKHAKLGQFVPIVAAGQLRSWDDHELAACSPVSSDITAEDFIVGLEMMGHRFEVMIGTSGDLMLLRCEPEFGEPPAWRDRANAIMAAFDRARTPELIEYVQAREARA